jgi:hypothetical protein
MEAPHHSEFTLNLLILITRMAAQGDYPAMRQLGIRYDQVDKLQSLSTQEIQQMAMVSKARFVSIQVDPDALDTAIALGHKRVAQHNLIIAMLKAGASKTMMTQLFGMTSTQTTDLRRFIALPKSDGRPAIPNEQQQASLWQAWQQLCHDEIDITGQLLDLHEKTGLRINAIWPLMQAWSQSVTEKML